MLKRRKMLQYLGVGIATMGGTIACKPPQTSSSVAASSPVLLAADPKSPHLPEFQGIEQWINSPGLSVQDLQDSVVLIQIWTFACINCQRTLPYIVGWHQKYAGLKVVGVHTPEFGYERDIGNVKQAVKQHGITYPVAIDNRFQTWKAYNNEYWPHLFLADRQGVIRYDHIGEGAYDLTEQTIQKLLG
jgi:thiol-disulfide isomerase/thioredoxin